MQVSVESTGALERRMRVDVPEDKIEGEIKNRLQSLMKTVRIDGFRQGKVPPKVVQQRYGKQIRLEVLGEIMRKTYAEALEAEKLTPAGEPSIEHHDEEGSDQGLSYTAVFDVFPEVKLNPLDQIKISLPTCDVVEADVDKMIESLRKQQSNWKEVNRKAAKGDQVNLDFAGFIENEKFEGGEAEAFDIELGSKRFIAGFEEGLVGLKAGESTSLNLEFPTPYQNSDLAGKAVRFDVSVNKVSEADLPELDDDFFQKYGVAEGGIEAFKQTIRENIERESEQRVNNQAKTQILNALHDSNPIELPQSLVSSEAEQLMETSKQRLAQQGLPAEQLDSLDKETFVDEAKKRVALGLLMSEIIKSNDMKADPGKVRTMIEAMATGYEDPTALVQWYYADQSRLADIQNRVLEEEVVNWITEQVQTVYEPVTFDVLMNPENVE
ncbi:MAG: trigger factor [Gammaproteobacteria bacterium]